MTEILNERVRARAGEPERAAQACLQPNASGENAGENAGEPERAAQACLQPNAIGENAGCAMTCLLSQLICLT